MSGLRRQGDKARLVSSVVQMTGSFCLEFWFHMNGAHVGTLNVYRQVNMKRKFTEDLWDCLAPIYHMNFPCNS